MSVPILGGQPFSDGNPAFGLQLHHLRFLEFVGAPESARLLDCSPTFWVDQLGKEQAMAAAVNLQRDAGIMLSNLQILSQFATSLHRISFQMMVLGIGQSLFPRAEVACHLLSDQPPNMSTNDQPTQSKRPTTDPTHR